MCIKKRYVLRKKINKLKSELSDLKKLMEVLSCKMHKVRGKYAKILEEKVNQELISLEMQNAKFSVKLDYNENKKFGLNGLDGLEFMISTNIGEEEKPLAKVASGGEMSRIMLGIKNVLADVDKVRCYGI